MGHYLFTAKTVCLHGGSQGDRLSGGWNVVTKAFLMGND